MFILIAQIIRIGTERKLERRYSYACVKLVAYHQSMVGLRLTKERTAFGELNGQSRTENEILPSSFGFRGGPASPRLTDQHITKRYKASDIIGHCEHSNRLMGFTKVASFLTV